MRLPCIVFAVLVVCLGLTSQSDAGVELRCAPLTGAVAGNTWTVLVETATATTGLGAHGSALSNVRHYAIVQTLTSDAGSSDPARVIGPLWGREDGRFSGERYVPERGAICGFFDTMGRLTWVAGSRRRVLEIQKYPSRWSDTPAGWSVPNQVPSGAEISTLVGGPLLALAPASGKIDIVDISSGRRTEDPWLTAALHRMRATDGTSIILTDDGNHLVQWPNYRLNRADGSPLITTFLVDGHSYARSQHALYMSRPEETPRVFRKPVPSTEGGDGFLGAIVVDDELLLVLRKGPEVVMVTTDNAVRFATSANLAGILKHEPVTSCLHFLSGGGTSLRSWYYREQRVRARDLQVRPLFRSVFGRTLEPISAEPVR